MSTMADPRPWLSGATEQLSTLVAEVRPAQLEAPTPCTEFDVRALLDHVVVMTGCYANLGAGETDAAAATPPPRNAGDREWAEVYAAEAARLNEAWADGAALDRKMSLPWGELPGREALLGCLLDTVTHSWDLARALGIEDDRLDEELAEKTLEVAREIMPAERRGRPTPFEPVRPVEPEAPAARRLAAWLGRWP
ncbi:TIGR03086 family metal-binding protein [Actinopolyspora saharensis]|uniref:TIGR03086 family protein n=1 Tax=Actinopolyspora saharensis TaxID=995062 RepID=A0A1H1G429_9ACTN|nr:TIGR03086 family metal-binding protein [Actinopolyspora saharensis]SDR07920.1 TIGR03086 family protein [Actinopolyspora saharensis]